MTDVCRTCFSIVDSNSPTYYNVEIGDDSEESHRYKILSVIPEINLSISKNPIICNSCHENLEAVFNFRMRCLQIEDLIMQYVDSKPDLKIILDLKQVMSVNTNNIDIKQEENNFIVNNEPVHIKDETPSEDEASSEQKEARTFECDSCGRTFGRKCSLTMHQKKHRPARQTVYTCEYCNKDFDKRFYYRAHLRIHTGDKRFECPVCRKMFALRPTLNKHLATHSEVRSYRCEFCDRTFREVEALEAHRNVHTVERNFQCEICKRLFYRKATLRVHLMVHTKERPFSCPVCGKAFNRKTRTKEHIVNMHKEVDVSTVVIGQSYLPPECGNGV